MNLNKYKPLLELLIIAIAIYIVHRFFFYLNNENSNFRNFHTTIETIYGFFFICSAIILFILIHVKAKSQENVGFVFLILTCIKMGFAYNLLTPILHSGNLNVAVEKINFFIIFILFLSIETGLTIRILNNKQ